MPECRTSTWRLRWKMGRMFALLEMSVLCHYRGLEWLISDRKPECKRPGKLAFDGPIVLDSLASGW